MTGDDLLERLRTLEIELHRIETRRDRSRMEELLHPDFEEIGRSGRRYSRAEVLTEFEGGGDLPRIAAECFDLSRLADGVALLTYRSARLEVDGAERRWTLRASLWLRTGTTWRMRFHQGTPLGTGGRDDP